MSKTVGVVGLGIMGGAIARNLVDRGWRVLGSDPNRYRCRELAATGVETLTTVSALVHAAPVILISLPSPALCERHRNLRAAASNLGSVPASRNRLVWSALSADQAPRDGGLDSSVHRWRSASWPLPRGVV